MWLVLPNLKKKLGKGPFFLLGQKRLINSIQILCRVKIFKRSAVEQDISFYLNFDILFCFRFQM